MSRALETLKKLISRGDRISISDGRLVITPKSNKSIPLVWVKENHDDLIHCICNLLDIEPFIYDSYSTGKYGKYKAGGVTLQFTNIISGEEAYAVYNAELDRARTTGAGKKGTLLPVGQFRIGKRYSLYKFWISTKLKLPPRMSNFHDYMGNLKSVLLLPTCGVGGKISQKIMPLLNVSFEKITVKLGMELTHNSQTSDKQMPNSVRTSLPNKESDETQGLSSLGGSSSTGDYKYGLRIQGGTDIRESLPSINNIKPPQEQSYEEWLSDWERN